MIKFSHGHIWQHLQQFSPIIMQKKIHYIVYLYSYYSNVNNKIADAFYTI